MIVSKRNRQLDTRMTTVRKDAHTNTEALKITIEGHIEDFTRADDTVYKVTHIIVIIIIIRLASCLVLSMLAWVRTCQTISHKMGNCKSVLSLQLGYTRLPVWTLIEA